MASHLDELALRWRRDPSERATIALCEIVRGTAHADIMAEVGTYARDNYASSVPCLVAAARMYMRALRLAEAQSLLVRAGKQAPHEGPIYRLLGEVLLRRGDAERAEKVFERAVAFGITDSETRLWLERSRVFKPMHASAGTRAVAAEVERTSPAAQDGYVPFDSFSESDSDMRDEPTQPRRDIALDSGPSTSRGVAPPLPPAARLPELPLISGFAGASQPAPIAKPAPESPPHHDPTPHADFAHREPVVAKTWDRATPIGLGPPVPRSAGGGMNFAGVPKISDIPNAASFSNRANVSDPNAMPGARGFDPFPQSPAPAHRPTPFFADTRSIDIPVEVPRMQATENGPSSARVPSPKELLDTLALVGVFEPPSAESSPLEWDKPVRKRRWRSALFLVLMMLAIGGGAYGVFRHVQEKRMAAHDTAERMLTQIETDLRAGKASMLPDAERAFSQVFDLESRSPRAAISWLRERALVGLLKGGRDIAFEDAIARARELQIPEPSYAFAEVASSLFQGDTSGAASILPRFDGAAEKDAYYQLFAGAALERAGDARALERYMAATRLDPEFVVAHIALIRLLATSGAAADAAVQAKQFRAKYPDRAEGAALVAMAWAQDPARGEPPPEVNESIEREADLPLPLQVVPRAVKALLALDKHAASDAKGEIEKGLATVDAPGIAVWLGNMAIALGDEPLARKAALVAVSFSAIYGPARVLAARVALLGDRLDEALKATEGLEPSSPDVAIVHAAVAYEKLDVDGLDRALLAVPEAARKMAALEPIVAAQEALAGRARLDGKKLLDVAGSETPWSDVIAMDIALDRGDMTTAKKIAAPWKVPDLPASHARALRLSRLARYDGRLDEADESSRAALSGGAGPRALEERVFVMVARGKASEVGPLLAKQAQALGPLATWLNAYSAASAGKVDDARGKTASLDPPPDLAPLPTRVAAAAALGTMKDTRRGYGYIRALYDLGIVNPDTAAAGAPLGMRPPPHR